MSDSEARVIEAAVKYGEALLQEKTEEARARPGDKFFIPPVSMLYAESRMAQARAKVLEFRADLLRVVMEHRICESRRKEASP